MHGLDKGGRIGRELYYTKSSVSFMKVIYNAHSSISRYSSSSYCFLEAPYH